eukprot:1629508-Alexandrium_andersonii.AAC.1
MRQGAPLVGEIPSSGLGTKKAHPASTSVASLRATVRERSVKLLHTLHDDPHAAELLAATRADAELGRMTEPRPISE